MSRQYLDKSGLQYLWSQIKTKFVVDAHYVHTDNNFTNELKDKLINMGDKLDAGTFFVDDDNDICVDYDKLFNTPIFYLDSNGIISVNYDKLLD